MAMVSVRLYLYLFTNLLMIYTTTLSIVQIADRGILCNNELENMRKKAVVACRDIL
jgi:hypothetical protein